MINGSPKPVGWAFFHLFIFKDFTYLFTTDTERKREAEREAGSCMEPDVGLDPGSPGLHPWPKVALNRWATRAAPRLLFHFQNLSINCSTLLTSTSSFSSSFSPYISSIIILELYRVLQSSNLSDVVITLLYYLRVCDPLLESFSYSPLTPLPLDLTVFFFFLILFIYS